MLQYSVLEISPHAVRLDAAVQERLPPSARRLLGMLLQRGALTQRQLAEASGMPERTIRFAIRRLRETGLVESMPCLSDCRTCYFFVSRRHVAPDALEQARRALRDGRAGSPPLEPQGHPSTFSASPSALLPGSPFLPGIRVGALPRAPA